MSACNFSEIHSFQPNGQFFLLAIDRCKATLFQESGAQVRYVSNTRYNDSSTHTDPFQKEKKKKTMPTVWYKIQI